MANISELLDKLEQATEVNKVTIGFMHSLQSYLLTLPASPVKETIWGKLCESLNDIDTAMGIEAETATDYTDITQEVAHA